MPGSRRASIVLPVPGGPSISRWWPPAAAITSASTRLGVAAHVRQIGLGGSSPDRAGGDGSGGGGRSPASTSVTARSVSTPATRRPSTRPASPARSRGSRSPSRPSRRAPSATLSVPRAGRSSPPSDSSPNTAQRASAAAGTWPLAASTPRAIARSKPGPTLRRYAGARFDVIRRWGNSKPELSTAARTRSRASRTALSASPTTAKAGSPGRISTSTVTGRESRPSIANAVTRASTAPTLGRDR